MLGTRPGQNFPDGHLESDTDATAQGRTPPMPRKRWSAATAAIALVILAATAFAARHGPGRDPSIGWREIGWRLPLDNWGQGRVWRAADQDITLFVRAKTGFCNCFDGIADDTEIDRIGDVDLHGEGFAPAAPGQVVTLGFRPGRKRLFRASTRYDGTLHVLSLVAATDCKAVVATLVSRETISPAAEAAAIAHLTSEPVLHWASNQYITRETPSCCLVCCAPRRCC